MFSTLWVLKSKISFGMQTSLQSSTFLSGLKSGFIQIHCYISEWVCITHENKN